MVAAASALAPVEPVVLVVLLGVVPVCAVPVCEVVDVPPGDGEAFAAAAVVRPVICTWCPTCDARSLLLRSIQDIVTSLFARAPAAAAAGPRLPVVVLAAPAVVPLVPVAVVLDVDPGAVPAVLVRSVAVVDAPCVEALGPPLVVSIRARFNTYVPFGARSTQPVRLIRSAELAGVGG